MEQYSVYLTGRALWNCASASPENPERMAVAFRAGTGGLHSAEN